MSKEKIVVVGAGGIGRAISDLYSKNNIDVIVGDINKKNISDVINNTKLSNIEGYIVDIRDLSSIKDFASKVSKNHNTITHYVFAAGWALKPGRNTPYSEFDGLMDSSMECIHDSIMLNLAGPISVTKALLPMMIEDPHKNKTITLISSINALQDYGLPAYSACKAGMIGFIKATTGEFGKYGIRGNVIIPGTVLSEITYTHNSNDLKKLFSGSALKDKLTTPEETAKSIYAITHLMTSMTGQFLIVDSGQTTITPWSAGR